MTTTSVLTVALLNDVTAFFLFLHTIIGIEVFQPPTIPLPARLSSPSHALVDTCQPVFPIHPNAQTEQLLIQLQARHEVYRPQSCEAPECVGITMTGG
jgi:hypothetical protein